MKAAATLLLAATVFAAWSTAEAQTCRTCVNMFGFARKIPYNQGTCQALANQLAVGSAAFGIAFTCDPVFGVSGDGLGVTACADIPYTVNAAFLAQYSAGAASDQLVASMGLTCVNGVADELQFYTTCGTSFVVRPSCGNPVFAPPPIYTTVPPPPPNVQPQLLPPPPPPPFGAPPTTSTMCTVCVNQLRQSSSVRWPVGTCDQLAFNLFDITPIPAPFACDPNRSPPVASDGLGVTACTDMDYFTALAFMSEMVQTYRPEVLIQKQGLTCSVKGIDEFQVYSSCGQSFVVPAPCFLPPAPTVFSPPPPPPPPPPKSPPSPPLPPANKKKKPPPPPPSPAQAICTVCVSMVRVVNPNVFNEFNCATLSIYLNTYYMTDLRRLGTSFSCPPPNGLTIDGKTMTSCAVFSGRTGSDSKAFVDILNNVQDAWKAMALWGGMCENGASDQLTVSIQSSSAAISCGNPIYFVPPGCQKN